MYARPGSTPVILDVSIHRAYLSNRADEFTGSLGAINGKESARFWDVGARARLVALMVADRILWMLFTEVTVDQQLGYRQTIDIPAFADRLDLDEAHTFWGAEAGVTAIGLGNILSQRQCVL